MRVVKRDKKLYNFELIGRKDTNFSNNLTNHSYHSYTYNNLYNDTWRSLALQLIPCLENKKTGEQIVERRL